MQNVSAALNEQRQAWSGGTNTISILPEYKPAQFDQKQEDSSRRKFDCDGERLWQCDGGMVCSVFMVWGRDSSKYSSDSYHHYEFESWKCWVLNQVKNKKTLRESNIQWILTPTVVLREQTLFIFQTIPWKRLLMIVILHSPPWFLPVQQREWHIFCHRHDSTVWPCLYWS